VLGVAFIVAAPEVQSDSGGVKKRIARTVPCGLGKMYSRKLEITYIC
jgi:hypothetical protein